MTAFMGCLTNRRHGMLCWNSWRMCKNAEALQGLTTSSVDKRQKTIPPWFGRTNQNDNPHSTGAACTQQFSRLMLAIVHTAPPCNNHIWATGMSMDTRGKGARRGVGMNLQFSWCDRNKSTGRIVCVTDRAGWGAWFVFLGQYALVTDLSRRGERSQPAHLINT